MKYSILSCCSILVLLLSPILLQAKRLSCKVIVSSIQYQLFRYGYTGQEKELELKGKKEIYNYRAREYDFKLKRFLSPDKAKQQYGAYTYVANNPVSFVDRTGNWFEINVMDAPDVPTKNFVKAQIEDALVRFAISGDPHARNMMDFLNNSPVKITINAYTTTKIPDDVKLNEFKAVADKYVISLSTKAMLTVGAGTNFITIGSDGAIIHKLYPMTPSDVLFHELNHMNTYLSARYADYFKTYGLYPKTENDFTTFHNKIKKLDSYTKKIYAPNIYADLQQRIEYSNEMDPEYNWTSPEEKGAILNTNNHIAITNAENIAKTELFLKSEIQTTLQQSQAHRSAESYFYDSQDFFSVIPLNDQGVLFNGILKQEVNYYATKAGDKIHLIVKGGPEIELLGLSIVPKQVKQLSEAQVLANKEIGNGSPENSTSTMDSSFNHDNHQKDQCKQ